MNHLLSCSHCQKSITRFDCLIKRNKTGLWFCSYDCQKSYRKKHQTAKSMTCPICNKLFTVKPYRLRKKNKIYCSRKCLFIGLGWGSKLFHCEWCGKEFRRRNAQQKQFNFCSRKCMGKWQSAHKNGSNSPTWKGGYNGYYGSDWKKNQRAARRRDNYICQGCGKSQKIVGYTLEIHHIKPFRLFLNSFEANCLKNLIALCRPCHIKADVLSRWVFDQYRHKAETIHPLQNDSNIGWIYFETIANPV